MLAAAPTFVVDVGTWAATCLAVIGVCAGLWRVPWVRKMWRRNVTDPRWERHRDAVEAVVGPRFDAFHQDVMNAAVRSNEREQALDERLDAIEAELRTNGGTSLRDAINRIEHDIGWLQREQWEHSRGTAD